MFSLNIYNIIDRVFNLKKREITEQEIAEIFAKNITRRKYEAADILVTRYLKDIPNTKIATENRAVTLMNLTDYLYTSTCSNGNINTFNDCLTDNWLHRIKISKEWTLTSPEEITPDNNITPEPDSTVPSTSNDETQNLPEETIPEIFQPIEKQMYTVGSTIGLTPVTTEAAVRPVVYLKERLLYYSGDGSFDNPYIIK